MKTGSKWGHPQWEASGGSADVLSERNKQLLIGPDRGLGGQVRDTLEEAGSLAGGGGAGQDGMFEGLPGPRTQRAGPVGITTAPRGVSR